MNQWRRYMLPLLVIAGGCARELQVQQHIGTATTAPAAATSVRIPFTDQGRWTLFELVENDPDGTPWPLPFRAEIHDPSGRVVIARVVDAASSHSATSGKGHRKLTWRIDELRGPFEANVDDGGRLPIDRVLTDEGKYTLRLTFPAAPGRRYEVMLLSMRDVYPWEE